jgi:hypothetical protein
MQAAFWSLHTLHALDDEAGWLAKAAPQLRIISANMVAIRISFSFGWGIVTATIEVLEPVP